MSKWSSCMKWTAHVFLIPINSLWTELPLHNRHKLALINHGLNSSWWVMDLLSHSIQCFYTLSQFFSRKYNFVLRILKINCTIMKNIILNIIWLYTKTDAFKSNSQIKVDSFSFLILGSLKTSVNILGILLLIIHISWLCLINQEVYSDKILEQVVCSQAYVLNMVTYQNDINGKSLNPQQNYFTQKWS